MTVPYLLVALEWGFTSLHEEAPDISKLVVPAPFLVVIVPLPQACRVVVMVTRCLGRVLLTL